MGKHIKVDIHTADGNIKKCRVFNLFEYMNRNYAILISDEGDTIAARVSDNDKDELLLEALEDKEYEEVTELLSDIMLTVSEDDGSKKIGQILDDFMYEGSRYVKCFVEGRKKLVLLKERMTKMGEIIYGTVDKKEEKAVLEANKPIEEISSAPILLKDRQCVLFTVEDQEMECEVELTFAFEDKQYAMLIEKETNSPYLAFVVSDPKGGICYVDITDEEELVKVSEFYEQIV